MDKQRDTFLAKDFIVSSNIIKYIKNIDITLKDFLLVLYFINVSNVIDYDNIKERLNFNDEEIMESFSRLLEKGYIEIDVKNEEEKMIEMVKLDSFYDKLYLSMSNSFEISSDLYASFEEAFGRTLSSIEFETINSWIEEGNSEETIKRALKESVLNGVYSFKYIDKILHNWHNEKVKNDLKLDDLKEESENKGLDNLENTFFDFDWFNND